MPGGIGSFRVVRRSFASRHFAPACDAIGGDLHQRDSALIGHAEAGFEGGLQAHAYFAQGDGLNPHSTPSSCLTVNPLGTFARGWKFSRCGCTKHKHRVLPFKEGGEALSMRNATINVFS